MFCEKIDPFILKKTLFISIIIWLLGLQGIVGPCYAQYFNPYQENYQGWNGEGIRRSPIRKILNMFSLTVTSGYGRTLYSHKFNARLLESDSLQVMVQSYSLNGNQIIYSGATNWLNATQVSSDTANLNDYNFISTDTAAISYKGAGNGFPINVSLTFDIERFRIGGGVSYEYHKVQPLQPKSGPAQYDYVPDFGHTWFFRYYLDVAARIYEYKGWTYNAEIEIGKMKYGSAYKNAVMQKGIYFNVGFPFEYELSEYFFIVIKPSVDIKNYSIILPAGGGDGFPSSIQHNQNAFYISAGVRLKFPEIPRCRIKSCQTQLKHVHGNKEFRGQPIYKKQNPKIGELYPGFYSDKLKNRKKINKGY